MLKVPAVICLMLCGICLFAQQGSQSQIPSDEAIPKSQSAKEEVKTNHAKQAQASPEKPPGNSTSAIPQTASQPAATTQTSNADQLKQDIEVQGKLVTATYILAGVGIVQAFAFFWTLLAIRKQAEIMKEHSIKLGELVGIASEDAKAARDNASAARDMAEAAKSTLTAIQLQAELMKQQTVVMERQTDAAVTAANAANKNAEFSKLNAEATRDNAVAAIASAEAARNNVEIIINKERARLRVEGSPLKFDPPDKVAIHVVEFVIHYYGSTEAFILDTLARAVVSKSSNPPPWPIIGPIGGIPDVITSMTTQQNYIEFIWKLDESIGKLSKAEIDAVNSGETFVHFCGYIKYKDVFDRSRETRFRNVWRVSDIKNVDGSPFGYWAKCGTGEDNKET